MKRKIIALLLTLTMLLTLLTALIACDATADESDDEKTTEKAEEESDDNSIKASKEFREVLPGAKRVTDIKSLILGISFMIFSQSSKVVPLSSFSERPL